MRIDVSRLFEKDMRKLSHDHAAAVKLAISRFLDEPGDPRLNFEPIVNRAGYFTIRASYSVRVLMLKKAEDWYELAGVGNHDYIYRTFFRRK